MNQDKRRPFRLEHWQKIALFLGVYDIFATGFSYFFALLLRFDFHYSVIPVKVLAVWRNFTPFYAALFVLAFVAFGLYEIIWRYASFADLGRVLFASLFMSCVHLAATLLFYHQRMPISYYLIGAMLQLVLVTGIRFSYRVFLHIMSRRSQLSAGLIMIVGAGSAGQMLLRDLNSNPDNGRVVCIIDDNVNKWGRFVENVRVVGDREILGHTKKKPVFMRLSVV